MPNERGGEPLQAVAIKFLPARIQVDLAYSASVKRLLAGRTGTPSGWNSVSKL